MGRKTDSSRIDTDHWQNGYDAGLIEGKIQGQIQAEDRMLQDTARDARYTAAHLILGTYTGYSPQHLKQIDELAQYLLTGHNPEAADSTPPVSEERKDARARVVWQGGTTEIPRLYGVKDLQAQFDDGWNSALEHAVNMLRDNHGAIRDAYLESPDTALALVERAAKRAKR